MFCIKHDSVTAVLAAKIIKRLGRCKINYGQMRFREILAYGALWMDIIHYTKPQVLTIREIIRGCSRLMMSAVEPFVGSITKDPGKWHFRYFD